MIEIFFIAEKVKGKFLDDLFKKTVATPCLYYLPLSNEQVILMIILTTNTY